MRKGILSLLATAFAWSWPNVMIRMLKTDFDVFTQSFFRYVAASVFLFTVGLIFTRKNIALAAGKLRMLLIPAMIMVAHQALFTAGIFMTSAVVSILIGRLNAVLIPIFSFILYEDERRVVGNRNFLLGGIRCGRYFRPDGHFKLEHLRRLRKEIGEVNRSAFHYRVCLPNFHFPLFPIRPDLWRHSQGNAGHYG
jgi:hypothetical protein